MHRFSHRQDVPRDLSSCRPYQDMSGTHRWLHVHPPQAVFNDNFATTSEYNMHYSRYGGRDPVFSLHFRREAAAADARGAGRRREKDEVI